MFQIHLFSRLPCHRAVKVDVKNLFLRLLLLYAVPDVKAAVMRLFEDDPQGYTKRLDTAFSVQNIVEELHYQHSDEAVRTVLNDMSGRAEPFVEQSATRAGRIRSMVAAAVATQRLSEMDALLAADTEY